MGPAVHLVVAVAARALSVPAPAVLTRGYGLRVIDYTGVELQAVADATGSAVLATDYLPQDHLLRVERMTIAGNSANLCTIVVYEGDDVTRMIRARDFTYFPPGSLAVAEYPSYLNIGPTLCLSISVTAANPGDQFAAYVQYQLVQKVLGQANWPSS